MGLASMAAFMSCGNETEKLRNAKDSVENVNAQQKDILYDLTETLVEVSTSLDSIAAGEGLLKRTDEGKALTRQQVIENLNSFKQMLAEQEQNSQSEKQIMQSQIARLTEEMSMQKHQTRQLETMYLNALRENDDLRNECGILTRKQVNEVLAENARLKEKIDANRY